MEFVVVFGGIGLIFTILLIVDHFVDAHNLKISQREWDDYTSQMTLEEKMLIYLDWTLENKIKHGWSHYYYPRL